MRVYKKILKSKFNLDKIMQNKKLSGSNKRKSKKIDPYKFSQNKIDNYVKMIQKTILSVQRYKLLDVITAGEMSLCIKSLEMLYQEINKLRYTISLKKDIDYEIIHTRSNYRHNTGGFSSVIHECN